MKAEFEHVYFEDAESWRKWLAENSNSRPGVWLIYYKKHTGKPRVAYNDAVEEALCFGWIDSTVKRIDDEKYMQQFTPRNARSNWSELNKQRVAKLIKARKMMPAGMLAVETAKKNGKWFEPDRPAETLPMSDEIEQRLMQNKMAWQAFGKLPPSHRKQFTRWVMSAKRDATRIKRCDEMMEMILRNEPPGMK